MYIIIIIQDTVQLKYALFYYCLVTFVFFKKKNTNIYTVFSFFFNLIFTKVPLPGTQENYKKFCRKFFFFYFFINILIGKYALFFFFFLAKSVYYYYDYPFFLFLFFLKQRNSRKIFNPIYRYLFTIPGNSVNSNAHTPHSMPTTILLTSKHSRVIISVVWLYYTEIIWT